MELSILFNRFFIQTATAFSLFLTLNAFASENSSDKSILVSIAPIHSIVSIITRDVHQPELLMGANSSPHDFQLKPSQRRQLNQANLFIWVGDSLETVLDKLVQRDGLELFGIEQYGSQLNLLPYREDAVFSQDSDHGHSHDHEDEEFDPHFWMSPNNILEFSSALTQFFMDWDPDNATIYQQNHVDFIKEMKVRVAGWESDLSSFRGEKILSAHDGFQYFESEYGFQHVASMQTNTSVALSIKRADRLNTIIQENQIACLFTEPQVPDSMIQTLVRRNQVTLASLDVLGSSFEPGDTLYFNLMDKNIQAIRECYK